MSTTLQVKAHMKELFNSSARIWIIRACTTCVLMCVWFPLEQMLISQSTPQDHWSYASPGHM